MTAYPDPFSPPGRPPVHKNPGVFPPLPPTAVPPTSTSAVPPTSTSAVRPVSHSANKPTLSSKQPGGRPVGPSQPHTTTPTGKQSNQGKGIVKVRAVQKLPASSAKTNFPFPGGNNYPVNQQPPLQITKPAPPAAQPNPTHSAQPIPPANPAQPNLTHSAQPIPPANPAQPNPTHSAQPIPPANPTHSAQPVPAAITAAAPPSPLVSPKKQGLDIEADPTSKDHPSAVFPIKTKKLQILLVILIIIGLTLIGTGLYFWKNHTAADTTDVLEPYWSQPVTLSVSNLNNRFPAYAEVTSIDPTSDRPAQLIVYAASQEHDIYYALAPKNGKITTNITQLPAPVCVDNALHKPYYFKSGKITCLSAEEAGKLMQNDTATTEQVNQILLSAWQRQRLKNPPQLQNSQLIFRNDLYSVWLSPNDPNPGNTLTAYNNDGSKRWQKRFDRPVTVASDQKGHFFVVEHLSLRQVQVTAYTAK